MKNHFTNFIYIFFALFLFSACDLESLTDLLEEEGEEQEDSTSTNLNYEKLMGTWNLTEYYSNEFNMDPKTNQLGQRMTYTVQSEGCPGKRDQFAYNLTALKYEFSRDNKIFFQRKGTYYPSYYLSCDSLVQKTEKMDDEQILRWNLKNSDLIQVYNEGEHQFDATIEKINSTDLVLAILEGKTSFRYIFKKQ